MKTMRTWEDLPDHPIMYDYKRDTHRPVEQKDWDELVMALNRMGALRQALKIAIPTAFPNLFEELGAEYAERAKAKLENP